ncbi:MAG: hypothetical protein IT303_00490 [Dehalococcoidia bacterium]|nr:hypothetical protein [Dehalococcoidia bacterium]
MPRSSRVRAVLILVVLVAALAATLAVVFADDSDEARNAGTSVRATDTTSATSETPTTPQAAPTGTSSASSATPTSPAATPTAQSAAEVALRSNAHVRAVTGDTTYSVTLRGAAMRLEESGQDREIGTGFDIALDAPISSQGPWRILRCRGTRQVSYDMPIREVQHITGVITHDGEILELVPERFDEAEAIADESYATTWQIIELPNKKTLWRGKAGQPIADGGLEFMKCPEGFHDD